MRLSRLVVWSVVSAALSTVVAVFVSREEVSAQDPIVMKIATVAPEGTPWEKQLRGFKTYVEKNTQGRVKVKMFMGGSLGGENALVRRVAQGSIQVFGGSTAALGSVVPELNVVESPFLFADYAAADRALDNPAVLTQVKALVEARGFKFGFWAENGFRSWFTKDRPIRTPADMRGLRMRSQEALVHLETYRAFGASPVPIDVTNVLTSLQTGVVDGFDNTPLFSFATSWYQAAGHMIVSQHSYQPGIIVYSKTWFDGLPADIQRVLLEVPTADVTAGRHGVRRMDPILLQNLTKAGVNVYRPTAADMAPFHQLARPVPDRIAAKAGRGGRNLLKAIRAAGR